MNEHDFLGLYATKAAEYLIGMAYLVLFIPFWRFLNGKAVPSRVRVAAREPAGWFTLPEGLLLHPGHAWARPEGSHVAVGMDDFGHRLMGPLTDVLLPPVGSEVRAGRPAVALVADGKAIPLKSPVDGRITEVNDAARRAPAALGRDPYGAGWLLRVEPHRPSLRREGLLSGDGARRFLEGAADRLRLLLTPELGALAQDGGTPVHGIAREIDPERWDQIVRSFLETD